MALGNNLFIDLINSFLGISVGQNIIPGQTCFSTPTRIIVVAFGMPSIYFTNYVHKPERSRLLRKEENICLSFTDIEFFINRHAAIQHTVYLYFGYYFLHLIACKL